jgi:hypothetical protein
MALDNFTLVTYSGTDIGAIYIEDIGKRKQLGGGDQAIKGQDVVIRKGDTVALANGSGVVISAQLGTLKTWSTANSELVASIFESSNGTLGKGSSGIVYRYYGYTGTQDSLNGGLTGLAAPLVLLQVAGATGVTHTGVGTKTDPSVKQGEF